jgi:hypothetical protein
LSLAGFGKRAKVEYEGRSWLVRTGVVTESESESVTSALARLQPPPALRMTTEPELRDTVSDMIVRLAPEYRGKIGLRYVGEGRFRLEGYMQDAAERDRLAKALSAALPDVRDWDIAIAAGDEAGEKLLADLRERGNWEIAGEVRGGALQMQVRLRRAQLRQWEQALLAARDNSFPFNAQLQLLQSGDDAVAQSEALPFEIRAAVGGNMPYVLLPGGQRLARGGEWQGWRLATVSDNQLVFENGSRRAVVPR